MVPCGRSPSEPAVRAHYARTPRHPPYPSARDGPCRPGTPAGVAISTSWYHPLAPVSVEPHRAPRVAHQTWPIA